jgi:hypothetical protein
MKALKVSFLKFKGVRALPKVYMGDREYYRDDRLEEFRAVNNPHERITFEEIRQAYLELISVMNYLFKARR